MSYIYMPENLCPKIPSAPSTSQESFNVETIRNFKKYYQDITDLKVPMKRNFFPQNYEKMCEYECLIRKTG